MKFSSKKSASFPQGHTSHRTGVNARRRVQHDTRPVAAFRQRGTNSSRKREDFTAPEVWHESVGRTEPKFIVHSAGSEYFHAATVDEIRERLADLPEQFTRDLEVVQLSAMTRKRSTFPCYGMQWGTSVYLYPIEKSLIECYIHPPKPQQLIEAKMYGGKWCPENGVWRLVWNEQTIKDFYLNNVLIHEVGHLNDQRNTKPQDRERFANWFAIEYGYRATRR